MAWQIDAVIGDGVVGLDIVGRPAAGEREAPSASAPAVPAAQRTRASSRSRGRSTALRPGDPAGLEALARAVGAAAGAECVSYSVRRGDAVEKALGWRLPTS